MRLIAYQPLARRAVPARVNPPSNGHFFPKANVVKRSGDYEIQLAVPGYSRSDFDIRLEDGILEIAGKHEEKETINYTRREFGARSFSRRFALPGKILADKIEARYEEGILRVLLPIEPPRRVEIA